LVAAAHALGLTRALSELAALCSGPAECCCWNLEAIRCLLARPLAAGQNTSKTARTDQINRRAQGGRQADADLSPKIRFFGGA